MQSLCSQSKGSFLHHLRGWFTPLGSRPEARGAAPSSPPYRELQGFLLGSSTGAWAWKTRFWETNIKTKASQLCTFLPLGQDPKSSLERAYLLPEHRGVVGGGPRCFHKPSGSLGYRCARPVSLGEGLSWMFSWGGGNTCVNILQAARRWSSSSLPPIFKEKYLRWTVYFL